MTTAIKRRRGTTAQHATFTGLEGEITVDTTKDTVVVHDGLVAGGHPLAKEKDPTFTGTVTLTGGTANGVAYLNGSKVLTTGSALTFDGSKLTVKGGNAGQLVLDNSGQQYVQQLFKINGADNSGADFLFDGTGSVFNIRTLAVAPIAFSIATSPGTTTEQMRLTLTGLGIGTSSPGTPLEVFRTSTTAAAVRLRYNSTSYYGEHSMDANGNYVVSSPSANGVTSGNLLLRSGANTIFTTNNNSYISPEMILDSSGNLGLGVTPSAWNTAFKVMQFGQSGALWAHISVPSVYLSSNSYQLVGGSTENYITNGYAAKYVVNNNAGTHNWYTAPSGTAGNAISFTQAMKLDASGNLLVGTTVNDWSPTMRMNVQGSRGASFISIGGAANEAIGCWNKADSGTRVQVYFADSAGGGVRGSITTNGTSTTYGTSSDYRLKENIQPMQNALGVVAQLNPVTYKWRADGSDGQGFIAHELQAVVPDCVTGEKDAVDAEGNPVYQGIDTSFLVATLTKAIQEQQEQINQLTARVAQLEGN